MTDIKLNFKRMREVTEVQESRAAQAVIDAFEEALEAVLEKHPKRGDLWEDAFSNFTCFNLAGAKIKRIEMLIDMLAQSNQTPDDSTNRSEIVKEIIEEAGDALAYIAFGMWNIG